MTDKKISQLPPAAALTGDELIPVVQSGVTLQTTASAVRGDASTLPGFDNAAEAVADGVLSAHTGAADPHPQYTTPAEAAAAAPVQSVAGQTGAVMLAKGDVGLGNVDNTSDVNKPVSSAAQTALDAKQATLVSGGNIKTINGMDVVGSGDMQIAGGVGAPTILFLNNAIAFADNNTLTRQPTGLPESSASVVCNAGVNGGVTFIERYVSNALSGTAIEGGLWRFNTYAAVSTNTGVSEILTRVNKRVELDGITVTMTGSGATRTLTASGGTPFLPEHATASGLTAALVETPTQTMWVRGYTSPTVVTVTLTDIGFANVTGADLSALITLLFSVTTGDIAGTAAAIYKVESVQPSYPINPTDRLVVAYFGRTDSAANKTLSLYRDGATHYSNIETPISHRHNQMGGLNEGDFLHLTAAEKARFDALRSVDNTADIDKPISTAVQSALAGKQATLVSGTNIKTINGASILGSGDMTLGAGAALTYTYTGILDVPIVQLPGASEMVLASPTGKERSYALLLSRANTRLTGLDFPNLEFIGGTFNPANLGALTSLSLPALTTTGGNFNPANLGALTSLSVPALTTVGGTFNPTNMAALTSLSLPALTTVGVNFNPAILGALTSLSVPALTTVGGVFNPTSLAALTSLSLPALTTVGGNFNPNGLAALTSLSLPALTTVGAAFGPSSMAALTNLSLPAIEVIGAAVSSGNAITFLNETSALSTFELPVSLRQVGGTGGDVTITSAALNQTSVDNILVRLAALDGTNGTTAFNNRTVTITGTSAAPSATGLSAKATLLARGCTVTHN